MARKISTTDGDIFVQRAQSGAKASPSEEAAIVVLAAEGNTVAYMAGKLERSRKFIENHKKVLQRQIDERHAMMLEDRAEDYTNIISLALLRMQERLVDDERADRITDKDLFGMLRVAFDKRQLYREKPTAISKAPDETDGRQQFLDGMAMGAELASAFNEGFEEEQRRKIAERRGELLEAETVGAEVVDADCDTVQ